jgi:hypothetical protein
MQHKRRIYATCFWQFSPHQSPACGALAADDQYKAKDMDDAAGTYIFSPREITIAQA